MVYIYIYTYIYICVLDFHSGLITTYCQSPNLRIFMGGVNHLKYGWCMTLLYKLRTMFLGRQYVEWTTRISPFHHWLAEIRQIKKLPRIYLMISNVNKKTLASTSHPTLYLYIIHSYKYCIYIYIYTHVAFIYIYMYTHTYRHTHTHCTTISHTHRTSKPPKDKIRVSSPMSYYTHICIDMVII